MTDLDNREPNHNGHHLPARIAPGEFRTVNLEAPGSELFSLHTYWQMLRKRRLTIIALTVIVTVLAVLYTLRTKPVYQATAEIEVDASVPPLQQADNQGAQASGVSGAYLQTQMDILKSNDLAWQTIQQFGLDKGTELRSSHKGADGPSLADARKLRSRLLAAFGGHLHVRLDPGSHIILVSYQSSNPSLAERIPNALVNHYLEYNFTAKYQSTRQVSNWMAKELSDLKQKVVKSQQALVNYEKKNDIADVSSKGNLPQSALSDLSKQLTSAQTELSTKKALYQAVKQNPSAAGLLTKDPLLSTLQGKYGDLETEYVKALSQYGPRFYKVVQIRKQMDEVKRLIAQEQDREEAQTLASYQAAKQQVTILSRAVGEQKAEVQKLNELQIPFNILKNEYQTNQQLYQSLLKQLKDAEVSAGLQATNIHVLDKAVYPVAPIRPRKKLDIAVGLLSGLLLGVTLAFIQEALDTSVKRPEDLESVIGAPVLGVIPKANALPGKHLWPSQGKNGKKGFIEQAVLRLPNSPIAEAYRALRTSVLMSSAPAPPQAVLFTSSQPREGKTTTCLNLALSLAQLNKRVLVIDADLRRGQMHKLLGLHVNKGLSDFLTGGVGLEEVLVQAEELPNLSVLPAGARPPSPADLLSSPTMEELVRNLRRRFEYILIDSPPLLLVTDPTVLSKFADGVILVTASQMTARKSVARVQRILETAGGRFLGAVVNRVDFRFEGDYEYSRYHFRYYSEDRSGNGKEPIPVFNPLDRGKN